MPNSTASWLPTRKWVAARITAGAALVVLYATHGVHVDEHTVIPTAGFLAEAVLSYAVRNRSTPGGVPPQ